MKVHSEPDKTLSDSHNMLPLSQIELLFKELIKIHAMVQL